MSLGASELRILREALAMHPYGFHGDVFASRERNSLMERGAFEADGVNCRWRITDVGRLMLNDHADANTKATSNTVQLRVSGPFFEWELFVNGFSHAKGGSWFTSVDDAVKHAKRTLAADLVECMAIVIGEQGGVA